MSTNDAAQPLPIPSTQSESNTVLVDNKVEVVSDAIAPQSVEPSVAAEVNAESPKEEETKASEVAAAPAEIAPVEEKPVEEAVAPVIEAPAVVAEEKKEEQNTAESEAAKEVIEEVIAKAVETISTEQVPSAPEPEVKPEQIPTDDTTLPPPADVSSSLPQNSLESLPSPQSSEVSSDVSQLPPPPDSPTDALVEPIAETKPEEPVANATVESTQVAAESKPDESLPLPPSVDELKPAEETTNGDAIKEIIPEAPQNDNTAEKTNGNGVSEKVITSEPRLDY